MLTNGPAKRVTIFINEDAQRHMTPLHDAIMSYLMRNGISGATATRAYSGFGSQRAMHSAGIEVRARHLPIRIEFVDAPHKVDEVLPELYDMVSDGLIEVQDTSVVKASGTQAEPSPATPREEKKSAATLLRVYLGEADKWRGEPLYDAIVKKLRMMDIAGATVYRGILGYGAKGHEHKRSVFHPMRDLPIVITVIDEPAKIERAVAAVEAMLEDGLIVTSEVEMLRLVRCSGAEAVHEPGNPS